MKEVSRREVVLATSALLILPGCLPLLMLGRLFMGRGLAAGLTRGASARAAVMTSTIGRANALASRTFSAARQIRDDRRRGSSFYDGLQVYRTINALEKLEKIRVNSSEENEKGVAEITTDEDMITKCVMTQKNRAVFCHELNPDRLVHYFENGEAAGTTRVENEDLHIHFADQNDRLKVGFDRILSDRVLHFDGNGKRLGESWPISNNHGSEIVSSPELLSSLDHVVDGESRPFLKENLERRELNASGRRRPGSNALIDYLRD